MFREKKNPSHKRHFAIHFSLATKIKNQCGPKHLACCQLAVSEATPKCAQCETKQLHPTAKVSQEEDSCHRSLLLVSTRRLSLTFSVTRG